MQLSCSCPQRHVNMYIDTCAGTEPNFKLDCMCSSQDQTQLFLFIVSSSSST